MKHLNKNRFQGIYPPIITPIKNGSVDTGGLERLVEHVISGGVQGFFILGTTGEGPGLSESDKALVIRNVSAQVGKRLPVLVAITDTVMNDSIALAEIAFAAGADAIVIAPPYYLPPGQAEFLDYLDFILPRLPLPLFLYNMPSMTKVHLSPATLAEAVLRPGIAGLKDSSGDMNYFHDILQVFAGKDLALFTGSEVLLGESVVFGAQGGVCGGANVCPELFVEMWQASRDGKIEEMRRLQRQWHLFSNIYRHGHHASSGIKGIKCALSLLGICGDEMAAPFSAFVERERALVHEDLEKFKIERKVLSKCKMMKGKRRCSSS